MWMGRDRSEVGERGGIHSKEIYAEEGEGERPSFFAQRRKLIPQHAHPLLDFVNPAQLSELVGERCGGAKRARTCS